MLSSRLVIASLTLVVAASAISACGGSGSSDAASSTTVSSPTTSATTTTATTTTPSTTDAAVGGPPAQCTKAQISKAVARTSSGDSGNATLAPGAGAYKCSGGWAVAFANVGTGQEQVTTTLVFQAEGQFWVVQDRAKVCPKPSKVPGAIYDLACNSN